MPRTNRCKNKDCTNIFYDNYNKPYCPTCEEEFLQKVIRFKAKGTPGSLKGKNIIAVPPDPNSCNPFQPRTWIVKDK